MLHGILIGVQCYSNPLIIMHIYPSDLHVKIHNAIQYALLHNSYFAHLCNKEFWDKWKEITSKKDTDLYIADKEPKKLCQDDSY